MAVPDGDGLVPGCATHVVVRIVSELKNVGREGNLVLRCISVVGSILLEDGVHVGRDVPVGVDYNDGGRADLV